MSSKNYGPSVSGYLDPTGRNFETTVFQAGKPVLDSELNLAGDISTGFGQAALRRVMPSGWLSDDFTSSSNMAAAIFQSTVGSNVLRVPNSLTAHVNGWLINVQYTGSTLWNELTLPAAPVGAGSLRTDVVVLEVWRRLLSASTPDGKSPTQRIWLNGNVGGTSDFAPYTLDSDILDTNVGQETTKRVQIQYRLRVISGVDLSAYPYGLNDPTVVAHTVPPTAAVSEGVATAYSYANQSASGDPGLWRAGDGSLAAQAALGTVDGYMLALPLMGVVRRNQTPFDRLTNHNGGVVSPGPSDRPDGLFNDIVVSRDIIDLRQGVSSTGWDYSELLGKNLSFLLDNNIRTEWATTSIGGGYFGHTVLTAAEIGLLPGDHITTGDTPGADFIGQFDSCRRFFSDRSNAEVVTVALDRPGGGSWAPGDIVSIDPTSLPVYPAAAFNWASRNVANVLFCQVANLRWVGETAGKKTVSAEAYVATITGLGAVPLTPIQVKIGTVPAGVTDERLFVDLTIEWPSGLGLPHTPTTTYTGSVQVNNPGALPPGTALANINFDAAHRELQVQCTRAPVTIQQMAEEVPGSTFLLLPERASSITTILKNGGPLGGIPVLAPDGRTVGFGPGTTLPVDVLTITYVPLRPIPENTVQVTVYYEARAPQTAREALIGTSLQVIPRSIDHYLHTLSVGSGSQDEAYPYPHAYVQLGGIFPTSVGTFAGDHELVASAPIFTSEFNASTGLLRLPTYIGYTPNPDEVLFSRIAGDQDSEGRSFFPVASGAVYIPNTYAQPLTDAKRHRNFLSMLAELPQDSSLGFKGQLVLLLLIREAQFDKNNSIVFDPDPTLNTTTASVFRIRGNLLNRRA